MANNTSAQSSDASDTLAPQADVKASSPHSPSPHSPSPHSPSENHQRESRPWGSFTVLEEGQGYKIKRVEVNPGQRLSKQMHYHRSEHWIVVSGTARVICGDSTTLISSNQSSYVPACTPHRLENPGVIPLVLIEVQNGEYLNESDVTRFEDRDDEAAS
ncbi:MAG: phosphomannose isomerase type II C-terminal cupin domain [Elainellaceae cyanobacterium]